MSDIPNKCKLTDISLPTLLINLNRQRATGTLAVSANGITKKIYIDKGSAIFASSTYEDDRLGEMLLKAGKITVEQYDKSVEMLKRTGMRQGAILVKLGYLTPKDLFWGVKYQVREIILSLFQLEDAECEFTEGNIPAGEVITLNMSIGNLIYEGVRRIENWTRIRREMPDTESILQLTNDPLSLFQDVELSPQDKKILSLIDGARPIKTVIEQSWLNSFEALKTLYLMWSIGILTEKQAEEAASPVSLEELLTPVIQEDDEFLSQVTSTYEKLGDMTSYELLELAESASMDDVKKSYYRLAKEFHPDRFYKSADTTLKDKLSAIFDAITDAYNSLKEGAPKEEAFKEAMEEMPAFAEGAEAETFAPGEKPARVKPPGEKPPIKKPPAEPPKKIKTKGAAEEDAEEKFKKAVSVMKKGDLSSAAALFAEAADINPEKAEYWSYLSLAYSKLPGKFKEAERAMIEALKLDPSNGDYYANLGLLYLKHKDMEDAKMQFEKALMLDPENQKAKKGLSQIK